ncbi:uncharacterized protein DMENIID0001_042840 [Sergentomyia squamirostris]
MKKRFYEIAEKSHRCQSNHVHIDADKYANLINEVTNARIAEKKNERQYRLLKRYDVQVIDSEKYLISPLKRQDQEVQYFASDDRLFEIMWNAHFRIGHGGRDRMEKELGRTYSNVTRKDIVMFLQLCIPCQQKQKSQKKNLVVKPTQTNNLIHRGQVDFLDFQKQPDGEFKYLLVYQDHLTKFTILKTLKEKTWLEVATRLLDIFSIFGAPSILESNEGQNFCNEVIRILRDLWPGVVILSSSASTEDLIEQIKLMMTEWMIDNSSEKWSTAANYVQFKKNCIPHPHNISPYEAIFGIKPKVYLAGSDGIENEDGKEDDISPPGHHSSSPQQSSPAHQSSSPQQPSPSHQSSSPQQSSPAHQSSSPQQPSPSYQSSSSQQPSSKAEANIKSGQGFVKCTLNQQIIAQLFIYKIFLITYTIPLTTVFVMGFYFFTILRILNEYILSFDTKDSKGSLKLCLRLHYEIYSEFGTYDTIFSAAETLQILATPALILGSFLGIRLESESWLLFYVTILSVGGQFFYLCGSGQFIFNETEKLFTNLYLTRWYEMSLNDQKAILMMMKMSKNPFGMKLFRVYDINIIMFVNVIKGCFSYCAILYTFL